MTEEASRPLDQQLRQLVRDVPDYPRAGIMFKDITPLLGDPVSFRSACHAMAASFAGDGITHVAAVESRGFLFGSPIALQLNAGVVPIRKRGKLPYDSEFEEYELEYGTDALEMHVDALPSGARVWSSMTSWRPVAPRPRRAVSSNGCRGP